MKLVESINRDRVANVEPYNKTDFLITLTDGTHLPTSRTYRAEVRGFTLKRAARASFAADAHRDWLYEVAWKANPLTKNLPALLKISMGMKGKLEGVMGSVKAAAEGAQAAVQGGGAAALKVGGCFAASLKAQADASVSLNVSVKASASASGSASAG